MYELIIHAFCRYEELRQQEAAERAAACTFSPRINQRARSARPSACMGLCESASSPPLASSACASQQLAGQETASSFQQGGGQGSVGLRAWWPGAGARAQPCTNPAGPAHACDAPTNPAGPGAAARGGGKRGQAVRSDALPPSDPEPPRTPAAAARLYAGALDLMRRHAAAAEQAAKVCPVLTGPDNLHGFKYTLCASMHG